MVVDVSVVAFELELFDRNKNKFLNLITDESGWQSGGAIKIAFITEFRSLEHPCVQLFNQLFQFRVGQARSIIFRKKLLAANFCTPAKRWKNGFVMQDFKRKKWVECNSVKMIQCEQKKRATDVEEWQT